MRSEKERLDPIVFAVIKARIDGIVNEMTETVVRTSRNPILYAAKDFSCSILAYDAKQLTMANSLPIHCLGIGGAIKAVAEHFEDDIHPGDCFGNNSPYHGSNHVGDFTVGAPVFYEGELICWAGTLCHLIDTGAHIPSNLDPLAKDVYEEGMHVPPLRMVRDYKEIPDITRLIKANFRYPEQWHGDFLAQIGSLWVAERRIIELCRKYGGAVIKQFQDEYQDYGDRRMTEEIRKLPKGTWSTEALSEKVDPVCTEGVVLKVKMSIDPDEATLSFDLTEMPDQLPSGLNVGETCSKTACIMGSMPSLDPTLPRNDGVFRHFKYRVREGAVIGQPRWPVGTSLSTVGLADITANMIFGLWEQVEPGRGHGGAGYETATECSSAGVDFRRNNTPYGHMYFLAESGGGASKGCDGWPAYEAPNAGGNMFLESIELIELGCPNIVWETGPQIDSGGAGQWRGAPAGYHRVQPRHTTITLVPWAVGHTTAPQGVAGGEDGALADHWLEKHATRKKIRQLTNASIFELKEDEDWVAISNGGGGYGDPLERDPEAVRDDARDYIISAEVARNTYGVVLDTETELYDVDYEATEKLRVELKKQRRTD